MTDTYPYILQLLLLRNVGFLELDLVTFYSFQILTHCSHESHSNSYTTFSIELSSYMFWWISEATESVEFHKKDSMDDQDLHIFLMPVNILKDIAVSICLSDTTFSYS